ncbi:MAG: Glucosamine-6-phosphate deaminase [isomerizing], alternative [uncultured Thermomicrobiales bacterium]|uniref:Glucosamine-6-phosphate deaminase [isomerizing], alternative n=1 Tax=uncultured Thermomicrobiales bacterium TaxID=1645740 RepID=A0A6J4TR65_9BACT|nr:MAG: Glucosamine-6-phosphate deaminase [isomerizing], alternative [uncultured Thermomicrobiales bacterium]
MSFAADEIRSQPEIWEATLASVPDQWRRIAPHLSFEPGTQVLFTGSGTSFYLALSAAHAFQEVTGCAARAVPASEIFLSPASTVPKHGPVVAFLFSRSGTTSEAVLAARHLTRTRPGARTIAISCNAGTPLAAATDHAIELPHAAERSMVMTRSFTTMLLAAQMVAATVAGDGALRADLVRLPNLLRRRFADFEAFAREWGGNAALRRFVYLGLGPNYGLAEEATLKLKEMTQVPCSAYNPLEFRHGPVSTVTGDTAVILLAGERERAYLGDVATDVHGHGAKVATIGPYPLDHAGVSLALPGDLSDLARAVLYLPPAQLLAHARAELLGLDPDAPRLLNPVVTLDAR